MGEESLLSRTDSVTPTKLNMLTCKRTVIKYSLFHRTIRGGWEKVTERINDKNFGVNLNKKFRGLKVWKIREKDVCVK